MKGLIPGDGIAGKSDQDYFLIPGKGYDGKREIR